MASEVRCRGQQPSLGSVRTDSRRLGRSGNAQRAHASAWHWTKVGTELNRMRATMLLAEIHALLGLGRSALAYAEEMRTYFLGVQSPDWEVAFVHVVHAHAASAAGKTEKHRASYRLAVAALDALSSEEERRNVADTFGHVPKP
jgi:hypothetical protein